MGSRKNTYPTVFEEKGGIFVSYDLIHFVYFLLNTYYIGIF